MMTADVTVLLIDDDAAVREHLQIYLEDEGFSVVAVESAEEGLKLLQNQQVGVAIVDMRLPTMSGNDFIRQAIQQQEHLHFIIHTGSLEYQLPADLKSLGLSHSNILYKPLGDLGELARRLQAIKPSLCRD